jgi:hypothetical protein
MLVRKKVANNTTSTIPTRLEGRDGWQGDKGKATAAPFYMEARPAKKQL